MRKDIELSHLGIIKNKAGLSHLGIGKPNPIRTRLKLYKSTLFPDISLTKFLLCCVQYHKISRISPSFR